ncbi:UDP-glucose 4-epimerase GEPI48 [Physcomitrium patens]|uniref:UDP-glucose 4-epimerase n=2 Tax=Physcomitrium patens TaxID=3218 RepID=A0A2K1K8L9_PHYPA|nr:UDP-glucose 4-epimerase GEPI48-like isoform X2 [Physcomitrium patens]PNR50117.1 hypothetical protein PHYPA_012014 [Physcomitrium patens]|eukprot:XP_024382054.1 UDP-glucose 4-epimerase GEPI48-like isoform X2 [Physcomitrella patens]
MGSNHWLEVESMESNGKAQERKQRWILVTGGAGYIGAHTVLQLLVEGYSVLIIDNLDNSCEEAVHRVRKLAGECGENLKFFEGDLCKVDDIQKVFKLYRFEAVIHFAGLKAVGESVSKPLRYYSNNLVSTINLMEVMSKNNCKNLVFSSSATVYGQPESVPCTEDYPLHVTNPYGRTKLINEDIMRDVHHADPEWKIVLLRYFNPVGSHPSGEIGEDPMDYPNNLMPFVQQVAVGRKEVLTVFGQDYPTRDGTGIRDYIHVMDLASGHTKALDKLFTTPDIGCAVYNLGTGKGTTVLEMVAAFVKASGKEIPLKYAGRRPGDCREVYAATEKAEKELGWRAKFGIADMCRDQWNWAKKNPYGYRGHQELEVHAQKFIKSEPLSNRHWAL